jgi:hypothetical protein
LFLGCDIDPACAKLTFNDRRIAVTCCDAASPLLPQRIAQHCSALDFIIDDGSHRSGDIIRSFAQLFPLLADDGIYVVEDLHCSYWEEFEGGLEMPLSSLAFFRALTDLINHEHWRSNSGMADWLAPFVKGYGVSLPESLLCSIRSVEFSNSMVVIRKAPERLVRLGARMVSDVLAEVDERPVGLSKD